MLLVWLHSLFERSACVQDKKGNAVGLRRGYKRYNNWSTFLTPEERVKGHNGSCQGHVFLEQVLANYITSGSCAGF